MACGGSAIAAAGCGGGGVIDPVAQAATASANAPGSLMKFSIQFVSPALATAITGRGTGSFDVRDHAGSVSFDMSLGNEPQVIQALGSSTLHLDEVIRGLTFYIKLPSALTGRLPGITKPWMKLDLKNFASQTGVPSLSSLATNPVSSDPSQFLQYLRAVSGTVRYQGNEPVDGFRTTHYHALIDLNRVVDQLPPSSRNGVQQAISGLEKLISLKTIPVDVWIDGQHMVRRMQITIAETLPTGQSLNGQITLDVVKYGPQPLPSLPPANQVSDIGSLLHTGG
jgi:hypothetical protein